MSDRPKTDAEFLRWQATRHAQRGEYSIKKRLLRIAKKIEATEKEAEE